MTSLNASMIPRSSVGLRGVVLRFARAAALVFACGLAVGSDCLGNNPGFMPGTGLLGNYAISPATPLATGGAWATYTITPVMWSGRKGAAAWVRANTSDLSVVSVQESDGSTISLRSGQAGMAELRLFDAQGQVVERLSITVQTPTDVQLTDLPPTILFEGSRASECPVTLASSDRLWTGGTLSYAFTGTLTKLPLTEQEYWGCQAGQLD